MSQALRFTGERAPGRVAWCLLAALAAGCGRGPQPAALAPQADTTRERLAADSARRDSLAALARRDSLARADSIARLALERARADSVRAQVLRDDDAGGTATTEVPSGLDPSRAAVVAEPIHFDFDKADLTQESVSKLEAKLAVLRSAPRLELLIEGHCDERGSDEYNLALGNRRAAAARRYLVDHGVAEGRLAIVSYGEERPADPGHSEEAWAKNRRAEFVVTRGGR
jgi:peptidoglycan-associated lipoprotein